MKEKKISRSMKQRLVAGLSVVLIVATVIVAGYLVIGKAGFVQFRKSFELKMGDGIVRELIIYDSEGQEMIHREGRFDFTHDGNYIEYIDTQTGKKYSIFAGNNAVITINELEEGEVDGGE